LLQTNNHASTLSLNFL